ncbi:hypothetical protein D0Y65_015750 [Glycine soja]|uniref:Uncharacterized protein n=1 Tax=Glycine soja TaxID=3848 RepID=A0A445KEK9_GLYSO|nr:hypothetical protein D0Y65_015750 [Glycine soja]
MMHLNRREVKKFRKTKNSRILRKVIHLNKREVKEIRKRQKTTILLKVSVIFPKSIIVLKCFMFSYGNSKRTMEINPTYVSGINK